MLKKFTILVAPLILLVNTATYAKPVTSCDKDGLACENSPFDFGLTALYFKTYSEALPDNSTGTSNTVNEFNTDSDNNSFKGPWDWGGIIDGRYHFADKKDLNLNWMYYSVDYKGTDTSHSTDADDNGSSNQLTETSGRIRINSVNAEFAQSFDLSSKSTVRLFAGAQYLNVKHKVKNASFYNSFNEFETFSNSNAGLNNTKYNGVGPRIGLDANYQLKGNFSVFANSAATILLARRTSSSSGAFSSLNTATSANFSSSHRDIAIPELEAKLGVTYNKPIAQGTASLSAGWSVINYFNLLDSTDLTLSGPFLQAKWVA